MNIAEVTYVLNRAMVFKSYLTAKERRFGLRFRFKIEDCVGRYIYKQGTYEEDLTHFLLTNLHLKEDDVVLDIGANIGWYSMILSRQFGCFAHAFEPAPINYDLLTHNVSTNGLSKITCHQLAISDETQERPLYLYKHANGGRHSLLPINHHGEVTIQAVTLNQFCKDQAIDIDRIQFLKIDIEGYEYQALKSATDVLGRVPLILSEFAPEFMRACDIDPNSYLELLSGSGYQPMMLVNGALSPIAIESLANMQRYDNIFWVLNGDMSIFKQ